MNDWHVYRSCFMLWFNDARTATTNATEPHSTTSTNLHCTNPPHFHQAAPNIPSVPTGERTHTTLPLTISSVLDTGVFLSWKQCFCSNISNIRVIAIYMHTHSDQRHMGAAAIRNPGASIRSEKKKHSQHLDGVIDERLCSCLKD